LFLGLAFVAAIGAQGPAHAATAYTLDFGGAGLLRFDTSDPSNAVLVGPISGAVGQVLDIDFRPSDGRLYGIDAFGQIVTIDLDTGFTTLVSNPGVAGPGLDFNPVADRLRIVQGQNNYRVNVDTGAAITDGNFAYAAGDPNEGSVLYISGAAYTNSFAGAAGTRLYYIDSNNGVLATTSDPNGGVLDTVGSLGVSLGFLDTGFDIVHDPNDGSNSAFAIFNLSQLYRVDLDTGAATLVGTVGNNASIIKYGLAIAPTALVPEPSTLALLVSPALLGLVAMRRRMKASS
jgi:hypothetical protein